MHWEDEGYLLSKNNFDENSIIAEVFTLNHGKYTGVVYGGTSRKNKRNFQIGNKISLNWRSKGANKSGYFNIELIKPIAPFYFEDKKRSICLLSATSILKILLPERQINENIYNSFEKMVNKLAHENWINLYINWELSLIKDLGFEVNFPHNEELQRNKKNLIEINNKTLTIPKIFLNKKIIKSLNYEIKEALIFNKSLFMENFIIPNKLRFPLSRNILEHYFK